MKRLIAVLLMLCAALPGFGVSQYWTITLDNQPLAAELPPIPAGNDALLVTARSMCQALRATYDYDATSGRIRVTRNGTVVEMAENLPQATVNGRVVHMPVAPRKEAGAMMVPVPFLSDLLGCRADMNASTRTLALTSNATAAASTATQASAAQGEDTQNRKAVPSAIPWLATGQLPPNTGFSQTGNIPQMPTVMVQPVPVNATQAMQQIPSIRGSGATLPTIDSTGVTLPASSGVQLPPNAYGPPDMRVAAGERRTAPTTYDNPYVDNSVNAAGKMDYLPSSATDAIGEPYENKDPHPDPAITGLTVERRYDQFVDCYVVRYRVTNLGPVATDRPMLVRLMVGGRGQMQIMQDVKVDRLDPNQSLNFEWAGDARMYPSLYDIAVRAQAKVVLDDQATDGNKGNNARTVRLSY